MKNILYFTDANTSAAYGRIAVNGKEILPPESDSFTEKFHFLFTLDDNSTILERNPPFILYDVPNGLFLRGHFETRDDIGRKIGFMFYSDTKNKSEFINRLFAESIEQNLKLNKNNILKKKRMPVVYIVTLAAILIIIALIIINSHK